MTVEKNDTTYELEGLDGWLILVGIGLVITPIRSVWHSKSYFADGGLWLAFSQIDWWLSISALEFGLIVAFFLVEIYLILLFFQKKRRFPIVFIWVYSITALINITGALLPGLVFAEVPAFDSETMKELGKSLVSPLIWIPYMYRSRRVKATFVR